MRSASEALDLLKRGNARFVAGQPRRCAESGGEVRTSIAANQQPIAVVVTCSDARVPPELVFDQTLGDLFVVRVGGNVVMPTQLASVEFGVEMFGPKLVVLLGHHGCGAIQSTIESIVRGDESAGHLEPIVGAIRPVVTGLVRAGAPESRDEFLRAAIRANIDAGVRALLEAPHLGAFVRDAAVQVIGAEYDVATGEVAFFD